MTPMSTSELLEGLIKGCFGTTTITRGKWNVEPSYEPFPSRGYFADRFRTNPDKPINARTATYTVELFRLALTTRTSFDKYRVSERLCEELGRAAETDLASFRLKLGDPRSRNDSRANTQIALLSKLLVLSCNKHEVPLDVFCEQTRELLARKSLTEPREAGAYPNATDSKKTNDGIEFLYDSVIQADYPRRIRLLQSELDVVMFHGTQWLMQNRQALEERLAIGDLHIRVVLARTTSSFFAPYAELKMTEAATGLKVKRACDKVRAAYDEWTAIFEAALNKGASNISLEIYFHSEVPAEAFVRCDNTILVTPTKCSGSGSKFPAFVCTDTGQGHSAYKAFLAEINAFVKASFCARRLQDSSLVSARRVTVSDFLERMLITCFGSTKPCYDGWRPIGTEQLPPRNFFSNRLKCHRESPMDQATCDVFIILIEMAIDGRAGVDGIKVSEKLVAFLRSTFRVPLVGYSLSPNDGRTANLAKALRLANAVRGISKLAIDREELNVNEVRHLLGMI